MLWNYISGPQTQYILYHTCTINALLTQSLLPTTSLLYSLSLTRVVDQDLSSAYDVPGTGTVSKAAIHPDLENPRALQGILTSFNIKC